MSKAKIKAAFISFNAGTSVAVRIAGTMVNKAGLNLFIMEDGAILDSEEVANYVRTTRYRAFPTEVDALRNRNPIGLLSLLQA